MLKMCICKANVSQLAFWADSFERIVFVYCQRRSCFVFQQHFNGLFFVGFAALSWFPLKEVFVKEARSPNYF